MQPQPASTFRKEIEAGRDTVIDAIYAAPSKLVSYADSFRTGVLSRMGQCTSLTTTAEVSPEYSGKNGCCSPPKQAPNHFYDGSTSRFQNLNLARSDLWLFRLPADCYSDLEANTTAFASVIFLKSAGFFLENRNEYAGLG